MRTAAVACLKNIFPSILEIQLMNRAKQKFILCMYAIDLYKLCIKSEFKISKIVIQSLCQSLVSEQNDA